MACPRGCSIGSEKIKFAVKGEVRLTATVFLKTQTVVFPKMVF